MFGNEQAATSIARKPGKPTRRGYSIVIVAFFLASSVEVTLVASPPIGDSEETETERLIATLASPNHAPLCNVRTDFEPIYPSGYDHAAQTRVIAARDALLAKGTTAFPKLIKHSADRNYCYNEQRQKTLFINLDVGSICRNIIVMQAEAYSPLIMHRRTGCFWVASEESLDKWWESHKHLSLHDIQLEGAKWALEHERKGRFTNAAEETAVVGDLNRLIARLELSGRPIRVGIISDPFARVAYLNDPDLKPTEWRK